jgi:sensor histidine kinase YesM
MRTRSGYVLRMAAANLAAAVFVAVAFLGAGTSLSTHQALEAFAVALVFAVCIGTPCAIVLPRVSPRLWRFRFPFNWLGLVLVMFGLAQAGSALAIGALVAFGYIPAAEFGEWFVGSFRYALVTTLTFGIGISAYEMMRTRLDAAELAIRTKERDEAEARRVAVEAQLASLESRVQPHFLFNTLNSIASLIPNDPRGAEQMTAQLGSLLRSSLEGNGRPLVPLEQELGTVRDYLAIERVRFGDRLHAVLEVDEQAAGALVPRFSLQTLVENAMKYAVAPRRNGGRVSVRAAGRDGRVRIEVEDDGPGFEAEALPANHGLALLRQRLALTYGDRATLSFQSAPGRTVVSIEIPKSTPQAAKADTT